MDEDWFKQNDKGYTRPTVRSRELRTNATEAERKLGPHLSARKLRGVRFNRQFPVGQFICDFVSREHRLVIELDGGHHAANADYDARRVFRRCALEHCGAHVGALVADDLELLQRVGLHAMSEAEKIRLRGRYAGRDSECARELIE